LASVRLRATVSQVKIRSFSHKGLKRLYEDAQAKGDPPFLTGCLILKNCTALRTGADLSGDMALRIEKVFGIKMDTLMGMQSAYDIVRTRKREKEIRVGRFHWSKEVRA
jgi:hypothetical protein